MAKKTCRIAKAVVVVLAVGSLWACLDATGCPVWANEIVVQSVKPDKAGSGMVQYGLTMKDFERVVHTIPRLRRVVPLRTMPGRATHGERIMDVQLVGTTPELGKLSSWKIAHGRFLAKKDIQTRNNIAIVGHLVAERLLPHQDPVGKNIRVGGQYFLIAGVLCEPENDTSGATEAKNVYIPLTTMRSRYGDNVIRRDAGVFEAERYELSEIRIVPEERADSVTIMKLVGAILDKTHSVKDYSVRQLSMPTK